MTYMIPRNNGEVVLGGTYVSLFLSFCIGLIFSLNLNLNYCRMNITSKN